MDPAMIMHLRKIPDRFSETRIDDEIVVMQLDSGVFFSLTGTAAAIWELIDGTRDRSAVLAMLARQFDGGATGIASEVDTFLAQLAEAGLVAAD
jgi:pyrroloquinoline quinone biosynthesis protein D